MKLGDLVFVVQAYLARQDDVCAFVRIEYLPQLGRSGAPECASSRVTLSKDSLQPPVSIDLPLEKAQQMVKLAEAKVVYERFSIPTVHPDAVVTRYQRRNYGLSVLRVGENSSFPSLETLRVTELGDNALDDMELAYRSVDSWSEIERYRMLGN
jgi:hypothetical protein